MAMLTNVLIAAAVFTYTVVQGRETYGELCKVYDLNEPLDDLPDGTGRVCRISNDYMFVNGTAKRNDKRYCKTYTCPTVSCASPSKGSDGCQRCDEQECQWGGKIYQPGEGGLCVDGCNGCSCFSHNGTVSFFTTLMMCSDGYFCSKQEN